MAKGKRKRRVCGVEATKASEKIWTWTVCNRVYRWCPLGNVEEFMPDGSVQRVVHVRSLDGAIAYTAGYSVGQYSVYGDLGSFALKNEGVKLCTSEGK